MIAQHGTLELYSARFRHNIAVVRRRLPSRVKVCVALKANAYGHGLREIMPMLAAAGVEWSCFYSIREALEAVPLADGGKVLALGPWSVSRGEGRHRDPDVEQLLLDGGPAIRLTLVDAASAEHLAHVVKRLHFPARLPIHVQVDTGLTRGGVAPAEATALFELIQKLPGLHLEGVFTHLSHGDVAGHPTVAEQIERLHQLADPLKQRHPDLILHAQNSGGSFFHTDRHLDVVRLGIAAYGLQPNVDDPIPGLQPVARVTAPILAIHERAPGVGVGYGHTFVTARASRLAIVPVGYAEGYPRAMTNRGVVQVRGRDCPVVGRVSMDQIVIDVTDVPAADRGEEVVVISDQPGAPNGVDAIARVCGTIGYEIATGFGERLVRRVVDEPVTT